MKMLIAAVSIVLALSGCAGDWHDATDRNRSVADKEADKAACSQQAQQGSSSDPAPATIGDAIGQGIAQGIAQGLATRQCMQANGWVWQKEQAAEAKDADPGYAQAGKEAKAAIDECRAKRVSGEIDGFAASAQCANPRIIEAYQKAHYPHMDLIGQVADERMDVAERIDDEDITEDEGQQEIADFIKQRQQELQGAGHQEATADDPGDATDADDALAKGDAAYADNDYAVAMRWYRVAADHGDGRTRSKARKYIGVMYENGLGVPKNHAEAAKWHHLSGSQRIAMNTSHPGNNHVGSVSVHVNRVASPKAIPKPKPCKPPSCK